jgi:hypothetical protein
MSGSASQIQWLEKIVEQLRAREGVAYEALEDGRIALDITYNGESQKVVVARSTSDYRTQKNLFATIRETLTKLGIAEGKEFVAAKRSRNPMSPQILAARAKQRKEFDAWQEVWRITRLAEKALDVDYEIDQMKDYY